MTPYTNTIPTNENAQNQSLPNIPPCPVCAGRLVPLRGFFRCSRCYFSICVGCEGVSGGARNENSTD
jgi:hypothetical protein